MKCNLRIIWAAVLAVLLAVSLTGCGGSGGGDGKTTTTTTTTGPSAPSAPTGVSASAGDGQVTISWGAVSGATSYNIYWSGTSGVTKTNGTKISSVTSPYTHTSLTNNVPYYYIVTALNSSGESAASAQVSATPKGETLAGKIAFVSNRDGNNEIYIMNTDGSNQKRITTHTGSGWTDADENPVWSPNAEKIVFRSWRDSVNNLFIVNADGTGEARLTSSGPGDANDFPSWSRNGDKIAFESGRSGQVQIYIMNADGSNQTRLTYATDPYVSNIQSFTNPNWSPDGSNIIGETHWFHSGPPNDEGGIYVFSVTSGNYTNLTHSYYDHNAVWSPDGSKIAFYRFASNNTSGDIYVMNSNGSGSTRLTEGINPAWSPDGSKIAFISEKDGKGYKLSVIQSGGSGEINLMGTLDYWGVDWTPSWSPDGKKLVFGYLNETYLVNSDGSGLKKITTGAQGGPAMWSPK